MAKPLSETVELGSRSSGPYLARQIKRTPKGQPRKPLPYYYHRGYADDPVKVIMPYTSQSIASTDHVTSSVTNKALEKLYDKLAQSEALLVAWRERQAAMGMVTSSLRTLVTIARAVKRRDPKIVRRVLKKNPDARDIIKEPSGLWLQYHFGWVPTVSDMHHALGVLGFDFPIQKVSGTSGQKFYTVSDSHRDWGLYYDETGLAIAKLSGEIYALNPNVHLATMLGFGQPLSVAWELTPFSWMIDYVVNVGDYLKNFEPRFPGVKTRNHCTTRLVKSDMLLMSHGGNSRDKNHTSFYMQNSRTFVHGVTMQRTLGWPSFQLVYSSPSNLKGQQASYIAAVLGQILTGFGKK